MDVQCTYAKGVSMPTTAKTCRINLRASERQEAAMRHAAELSDSTVSEFILRSAVEHAERVLADRRRFTLSDEEYSLFLEALDSPIETAKLRRLFERESPIGSEITLRDDS